MPSVLIVGTQWGDEGKGKLVDYLTDSAQVVARYQGGHNAGHTVVINNKQFILHLLPSGILRGDKLSVIGNGTVVDPGCLLDEMDALRAEGINVGENLLLSKRAHLIMPYHLALEKAAEERLGAKAIGTTLKGIGPAYTDKAQRTGLRVVDLLHPKTFRERLEKNLEQKNEILEKIYGVEPLGADPIFDEYMGHAERLRPHIADTDVAVNGALREGKNVLFEGAQGTLLDIDHGTYPYVTSSSASAGGLCTGLGVPPTRVDRIVGVVKAYTTRVGGGPFPTEIHGPLGAELQKKGGEFGATTGRPRRCGWLDMVALRHSAMVNGLTGIAITKLDILDGQKEIEICTSYECDGEILDVFPADAAVLERCKPRYESFPGWGESTVGLTSYDDLPDNARKYLKVIEEMLGVAVSLISTGPRREELILVKEQF
ncbi:MAG: adenylosuccinate synthase [Nitrospirota bacterium]|jgi:adenylosuccinate synthase